MNRGLHTIFQKNSPVYLQYAKVSVNIKLSDKRNSFKLCVPHATGDLIQACTNEYGLDCFLLDIKEHKMNTTAWKAINFFKNICMVEIQKYYK